MAAVPLAFSEALNVRSVAAGSFGWWYKIYVGLYDQNQRSALFSPMAGCVCFPCASLTVDIIQMHLYISIYIHTHCTLYYR